MGFAESFSAPESGAESDGGIYLSLNVLVLSFTFTCEVSSDVVDDFFADEAGEDEPHSFWVKADEHRLSSFWGDAASFEVLREEVNIFAFVVDDGVSE